MLTRSEKQATKMALRKSQILKMAAEYTGTSFSEDHPADHMHAFRQGYVNELMRILHGDKQEEFLKKKNRIINLVKRYKDIHFATDHKIEHYHASRYGYLKEINKILELRKKTNYEKEANKILKIASKYRGHSFSIDFKNEYNFILGNEFPVTHKEIIQKVKSQYKSLIEWKISDPKNYSCAVRQGMIRRLCEDIGWKIKTNKNGYLAELRRILALNKPPRVKRKDRILHSKENTLNLAREYKGKSFTKDYYREHWHAIRKGYVEELNAILGIYKAHMKKNKIASR